jgi:DNA-binding MarR family transcriptional regulator
VEEGMSGSGLTLARTKVLAHLQDSPARPGGLAGECGVAARTITNTIDGLERDGLVARQPDPADRRATLVAVTSRGQAALAVAGARRTELLRVVFGSLDAADRAAMARLLGTVDQGVTRHPARQIPFWPAPEGSSRRPAGQRGVSVPGSSGPPYPDRTTASVSLRVLFPLQANPRYRPLGYAHAR